MMASPQGDPLIHIKTTKGRKRRLQDGEADRILQATEGDVIRQAFAEHRATTTDAQALGRLPRSESAAISDAAYISDFFAAMLETGCRPGELRTLQWSDVKPDHFTVLAAKAKDREDRDVPIEPVLQKILDRRKKGPDGAELALHTYVFGDETGEPRSKERLCGMWRRVCARAKVYDLHLHDLRAEFASQLSEAKVPVDQVRDALGHSSITMTNAYLRSRSSLKGAYQKRTQHQARQRMRVVARG